jgi:hypothetical protein
MNSSFVWRIALPNIAKTERLCVNAPYHLGLLMLIKGEQPNAKGTLNMPHGFFTVEQWKRSGNAAPTQWIPILHLDSYQSITKALAALERRGEPGLFRVVQMQRCVWAEMEDGKLRLHGSHASSPENLAQIVEIFEREGGRRPIEKARQQRAAAKAKRSKK